LEMEANDQQVRMQRMRETLKNNNIYRWAARLVGELAQIRIEKEGAAHS